ncbi:MAG: type II toxin-antitoxin system VapC family toxin [Acidobacteria bacterium]|nr:type II toxin-antitoxin system VapC family toxin [Acidobacteriota bacterium]
MALFYLDTSALVKLYVREPGTDQMVRLANPATGNRLAVLALARVEFRAAVRQRERLGDVPHATAATLIARMEQHFQSLYLVQLVTEAVIEEASALLDRHALKGYDAVQLAGCLALQSTLKEPPSFVCSDRQLLRAAELERLPVFNPLDEP